MKIVKYIVTFLFYTLLSLVCIGFIVMIFFMPQPVHAITLPEQREDKIVNSIQCQQWFMEGNGWEIRAFFRKDKNLLYYLRIWGDGKEYKCPVEVVK